METGTSCLLKEQSVRALLELVYRFKQELSYLLLEKGTNQRGCCKLAPRLLRLIAQLLDLPLPSMVQLRKTLRAWHSYGDWRRTRVRVRVPIIRGAMRSFD